MKLSPFQIKKEIIMLQAQAWLSIYSFLSGLVVGHIHYASSMIKEPLVLYKIWEEW